VEDLVRPHLAHRPGDRYLVPEVALHDAELAAQVVDVLGAAAPAAHAEDLQPREPQQVVRQVAPHEAGDARDEDALRHDGSFPADEG
jgi:hypothetical protein